MRVTVKLFALLREIAERSETVLEVPEEISCGEILSRLRDEIPSLFPVLEHCFIAVNGRYADKNTPLSARDEVAILPPVSGG